MNKFWPCFFIFWPIVAIVSCVVSPAYDLWFPSEAFSPLGIQIDNLFYLILVIVTVTFIGTQIAMGYVLWKGVDNRATKAWFTHGSHNLEVLWSIAPAGILLFISLYQLDVWRQYRIRTAFPKELEFVGEVTARQFEWRIRYPSPDREFTDRTEIRKWLAGPQEGDLHTVNDLRVPINKHILIQLRTMDVQHSFFVPALRVKQDAVPGTVIPIWFEVSQEGDYDLTCTELCGWGHYKMRGRVVGQTSKDYRKYLETLRQEQSYDGVSSPESVGAEVTSYPLAAIEDAAASDEDTEDE